MAKRRTYETGMKFGGWTLVSYAWSPESKMNPRWLCRCECGTEKEIIVSSAIHGASQSCGCLKKPTVEGARVATIIKQLKMNARRRNKTFNLTYQDVAKLGTVQSWCCAKTGAKLDMSTGVKSKRVFGPSIDRIDNSIGYEPGNIQLVCNLYNLCKNEFTDADVLVFAKALLEHQGLKS